MSTPYARRALLCSLSMTVVACHAGGLSPTPAAAAASSAAVRADITYLASEALAGRETGTPGNDSAAAYLRRRYAAIGLSPVMQTFNAQSMEAAHAGLPSSLPTQNVFAIVWGRDATRRSQYLVVGAHFDHLGRSSFGALDPDAKGVIRPGADDNASGTAAVLELARIFAERPAARSIVFVNFTGEELGLLGSAYFVEHPPVSLDSVTAMINFDMVGRLRNDRLIVYGDSSADEMPSIVRDANVAPALTISAIADGFGPSDQSSFLAKNIPVLHLFTDVHEDYHRASDVAGKINADGEARVIDYAARVIRSIADRPARLTFHRVATRQTASGASGYGSAYFGSIPDMGATDASGLRLTGVREGSPADKAGIRAGDVLVEFGGLAIKDLYVFTDALRAHKPGDVVDIVIQRGGERLRLTATLGTR
ncbi:MAG: M28 family peptidase [Gemmatimonadaceae bacterium]